ncbi:Uncharacterised protein [Plesiomonas shigelloides]|nr:hypothetical protein [Plesiomonas shigelloides]SPZ16983.1 Uncharacterised protein [Plesiomonas shigelloides]
MNDSRPVISVIGLAELQMTKNEIAKNGMAENEKGGIAVRADTSCE